MISPFVIISISYILGTFSTGYYLVSMSLKKDIRLEGSGGTGARNVGRLLGAKGFLITFIGDTLKGIIAVGFARFLHFETWVIMLVIISVVAGHIWPLHLKFQGGKGASTAFGAVMIFDFRISIILFITAVLVAIISKRSTLGGIIAMIMIPVIAIFLSHTSFIEIGSMTVLTSMLLFAHRANIKSILSEVKK